MSFDRCVHNLVLLLLLLLFVCLFVCLFVLVLLRLPPSLSLLTLLTHHRYSALLPKKVFNRVVLSSSFPSSIYLLLFLCHPHLSSLNREEEGEEEEGGGGGGKSKEENVSS